MDTKWVKESFDKGKAELLKIARVSKIKIEITSLKKKKEERIKLLGNKVIDLIESDMLDAELFEPDYSYVKNLEKEIAAKEETLEDEKRADEESDDDTASSAEDIGIVKIEAQKVLTAKSIPVEPKDDKNK